MLKRLWALSLASIILLLSVSGACAQTLGPADTFEALHAQGVPMDGCTLEGAEVHTRVISHIQRNFPIRDFQNLRREGDMNVVEGLYDLLMNLYAHPRRGALEAFGKENSAK